MALGLYPLRLLLLKNSSLFYRDTGSLFVTIIAPFLVMLLMYFDQLNIDSGSTFTPELLEDRNPTPRTLTTIPPCVPRATDSCYTIAYSPNTDGRVNSWIDELAKRNSIREEEIISFPNEDDLNDHFLNNPNTTQGAYVFNDYSLRQLDDENISFIVQYNTSTQRDFPLGETYFDSEVIYPTMAHQMQTIIMEDFSNKSIDINLDVSIFPHPAIIENDLVALDAFSTNGPLLTFATYFIVMVFFLYRIVLEKERGLRDAMKLSGQTQFQHFVSWTLPFFVTNVMVTFLLILFGVIFRFKMFTKINFFIYFLTMFIFSISIMFWTLLLSNFLSKTLSVSSVGFNVLIFSYVIASATSIIYLDTYAGPMVLRQIFAISPVTTFYRALQYLAIAANFPKSPISWENINEKPSIFSVGDCWRWMAGSGAVAFILAIYLDNVIPSPHGAPLSPFYFLQPSYWFPNSSRYLKALSLTQAINDEEESNQSEKLNHFNGSTTTGMYDPNVEDEDVKIERELIESGQLDTSALVIKNLSKKFRKFQAVDDLSLSIPRNTAFALLGHNGAGKSVTMKMLTTTLKPTSGDAYIYGLSVNKDRQAVRKFLGVCPQFDTFWDNLTGSEHIRLFAALRGLSKEECEKEIDTRLHDVDLLSKKDIFAGKYSGGMQRRLSVAISLTGDPKVLFLDECTSGADVIVRRDLWSTIERAKKGRVIFMITHSIAEAEYIAGRDRIGIIAKGKLRVLGNSMHLKTKFGAGHSFVVVLDDQQKLPHLQQALVRVCQSITIKQDGITQGEKEGEISVTFLLPRGVPEIDILKVIEVFDNEGESFGIRDYSMDSTSLGEVFKAITSLSEDVKEKGDD